MKQKRKNQQHMGERFLNKTQEVHYQKDFKRANRAYESMVAERNRS